MNSKYQAFLDSSVLFTAVNSITGGSSKLFTYEHVSLCASVTVLAEVERNVRKKLYSHHLERFFFLIKKIKKLDYIIDEKELGRARKVIVEKDALIFAEAKKSKVPHLLTLDKKDFIHDRALKFMKPQKVLSPKEFIELLEH
jgi:predicted nucleic acid-binding protein